MNGVRYYVDLLGSLERIRGMCRGVGEAVAPGDRVLEIGTGLGTFAFAAVEAGAREVVAIDSDPIVHLAESAALANGTAERIRFVRGRFPEVAVGGAFDLVIFEDLAELVLDRTRSRILAAAHALLVPGGRIVPRAVRCAIVPVTSPELGARLVPELDELAEFGLAPELLRSFLAHEPLRTTIASHHHLAPPALTPPIPLLPPPTAAALTVRGEWTAGRDAVVHALSVWFDLEVARATWVSNGPEGEAQPWGEYALPLHPPLVVPAGATLTAEAGPGTSADGVPGGWRWRVECGGEVRFGDVLMARPFGPPDFPPAGGGEEAAPATPPRGSPISQG